MEQTTPESKMSSSAKLLASIGFIFIIIFVAWATVRLVGLAPNAFSSLASLAESVNPSRFGATATDPVGLTISNSAVIVSAGEPTSLSWNSSEQSGTYTFSYTCREGVAVDLINVEGLGGISCDTTYNIGKSSSLSLKVDSEKERFAELAYTIAFLGTNDTTPRATGSGSFTVLNSGITEPTLTTPAEQIPVEPQEDEPVTTPQTETTPTQPAPIPPTTVTDTTPAIVPPVITEIFSFTPVSDPNGATDLGVSYLGTGTILGNSFRPGTIARGNSGAIQFEVRNYGTKTSDSWTYSVTLPNGNTYTSPKQTGLKPNERTLLSIGFPATNITRHTFTIIVLPASDYSPLNNSTAHTVTFIQ